MKIFNRKLPIISHLSRSSPAVQQSSRKPELRPIQLQPRNHLIRRRSRFAGISAIALLALFAQKVSAQTPIWPEGASEVIPFISDVFGETNNDSATYEAVIMTNDTVINQLRSLEASSGGLLKVGPLLQDGNPSSLFATDLALLQQINNTLNAYPGMKIQTDTELLAKMGKSTQGREIWGARMANPGKEKLIIDGGLHGNEPLNTRAILNFIVFLLTDAPDAISIRNNFDILFVPRVNVDGGEPGQHCFQGSDNAPGVEPFIDTNGDGVVDAGVNCALYRLNVDPRAGTTIAGENLAGLGATQVVKGQGWDLNRYMHTYMDKPIFPIEARLMVYVLNKFYGAIPPNSATARRGTLLDLHQKDPQIACKSPTGTGPIAIRVPDTDPRYSLPNTLFFLPAAECSDNSLAIFLEGTILPGGASVTAANQAAEDLSAQRIASKTITDLNSAAYQGRPFSIGRWAQVSPSFGANTKILTDGARLMGIQATAFETEGIGFPSLVLEVPSLATGGSNGMLWNYKRYTALPELAIKDYLLGIIDGIRDNISLGDNGFSTHVLPTLDVSYYHLPVDVSQTLTNDVTSWNTYWQTATGASCALLGYYPLSPLPTPSFSFKCFQNNAVFPIPTAGIGTSCITTNCGPPGSLQRSKVTPSSFSSSLTPPASETKTLTIANTDTAISSLTWTVSDCTVTGTQAWLSIGQSSGTTGALQTTSVSLGISSAGQSYGQHNATLCVTTNDSSHPTWQIPVSMFVEDHTGPTVACPAAPTFFVNQSPAVVTADITDEAVGSGAASPTVSGNAITSLPVGSKTLSLTGYDNAGNPTTVQCPYNVIYNFTGFLFAKPFPQMNDWIGGLPLPMAFTLAGVQGKNVIQSVTSRPIDCTTAALLPGSPAAVAQALPLGYVAINNTSVYLYTGQTSSSWNGPPVTCRQFTVTLIDGTTHDGNVRFKKK